jgi:antitoxin HicB
MSSREYEVVLTPEEKGGYSVTVPALPGCNSQGETREEALAMIREAIELYLESLEAHGDPIPGPIRVYERGVVNVVCLAVGPSRPKRLAASGSAAISCVRFSVPSVGRVLPDRAPGRNHRLRDRLATCSAKEVLPWHA